MRIPRLMAFIARGARQRLLLLFANGLLVLLLLLLLANTNELLRVSDKSLPIENFVSTNSRHFVVDTPACTIPDFDVLDPSLVKFKVKNPVKEKCSPLPPLTYAEDFSVHLNLTAAHYYLGVTASGEKATNISKVEGSKVVTDVKQISCCYRGITRIQQDAIKYDANCDKQSKLSEHCTPFTSGAAHNITEDGVLVLCSSAGDVTDALTPEKALYKDVHSFLQPRRAQEKVAAFQARGGWEDAGETLNVIILGTDSVSRLNIKRNMPRTFQLITEEMEAVNLKGYNKVAYNTFPNLLAVLTGITKSQHYNYGCGINKNRSYIKFDNCPLIFKDYSAQGYVTAYAEDSQPIAIFNYLTSGFVMEPTDYYNRPYGRVSEQFIGHTNGKKTMIKRCQGSRTSMEILHKYVRDFTAMMQNVPYFGLFWSAAQSHDVLELASAADEHCYNTLKLWSESNLLNRTILLFMSDHGMRWGKIQETYVGMLEERWPYVMIVFPKWFKKKYAKTWNILSINSRRLVSNYDLHLTLRDVLTKSFEPSANPKSLSGYGQSLFTEISTERTCESAGIPKDFCTCHTTKQLSPNDLDVEEIVKFVINSINSQLNKKFQNCSHLSLQKIMRAQKSTPNLKSQSLKEGAKLELYSVAFSTVPGNGHFEATVNRKGTVMQLSETGSRTNSYGNQSHCITDSIYKPYCYCKDLL